MVSTYLLMYVSLTTQILMNALHMTVCVVLKSTLIAQTYKEVIRVIAVRSMGTFMLLITFPVLLVS